MAIAPYIPRYFPSLPTAIWSGVGGLPVFPILPGQSIVATKAPLWSTEVIRSASGRERRTSYWAYPLWQFEVSYEVIRKRPTLDELSILFEFFNTMKGQFGAFLFLDPADNAIPTSMILDASGNPITDASGAPLQDASGLQLGQQFGTGDGTTKVFYLTRPILTFTEPIYAAFQPSILDNGALVASSAYTLVGGQITFTTAPASGHVLAWAGYYYFGCRFLQDDLTAEQMVSQLYSGKSLKFTSLRS
jgi:hypothetical protein